jgi:hypothetical protein
MNEYQSHERYARGALIILGAGVLAEGARLLTPWPGFSVEASRSVSSLLIVFWTAGAVALLLRRRRGFLARVAWWYAFAAPASMLMHGTVTRVGGSQLGLLYLVAAAVLGFALKRTFDHERQRRPHRHPGGKPPEGEFSAAPASTPRTG